MKRCGFDGDPERPCPVLPEDADYGTIRESCTPDKYGKNCGGIVAQQLLMRVFDFDSATFDLDTNYGLIDAYARVKTLPEGEAPDEIKSQVVGMSLPLRANRPRVRGKVPVVHADLALTLLNHGRVEAANWYNNQLRVAYEAGKLLTWWHFRKSEVDVNKRFEPCDSLMEYDGSFRLGNPALSNTFIPPLFYAREARGEAVLPQTVPISLPDAPAKTERGKRRRVRPRASIPKAEPVGRAIENIELPE
jgi:hypothetical protein